MKWDYRRQRGPGVNLAMAPRRRAFWRLALVFLGAMAAGAFMQSPLFTVESVTVTGGNLTASDVMARTGLELPINFFSIKTKQVAAKLAEDPGIARAEVKLGFPNRLEIVVTPRKPILAYPDPVTGQFALLAEDLVVVSLADRLPREIPVLNGLGGRPPAPGKAVPRSAQIESAIGYWRVAKEVFGAGELSEVFSDADGKTTVYLRDGRRVVFGDLGNISAKEEVLLALVKQLSKEGHRASELNLSDPERPLVRY